MKTQETIKQRRTLKVLGNEPEIITDNEISKSEIDEIIASAGKAPFHYPSNEKARENSHLKSLAPWRFYVLDTKTCRELSKYYTDNAIDGGKIVQMLNTATALVQATWIPDNIENSKIEFNQKNIEHIAATSAAIQNMLLVATEKNYETYWCSGGTLRDDFFKKLLNIPIYEQLLGSIFIFKNNENKNHQLIKGAWRNKQGENKDYSQYIKL